MRKHEDHQKQNRLLLLFKVLSNANRFKIIKFLSECGSNGATFGVIAEGINISESNLSNHLKLMRISKVVSAKQQGLFMHYSIKEPLVIELISSLKRS
jgi:ArsR family transcriptional regulator